MRNLVFTLLLISCGGGSGTNGTQVETPEGVTTSTDNSGFSMSVNFESTQGLAHWTIEAIDGSGNSLGVCEFEQKDKTDKTPMYFKNNTADPVCSLITIDPLSTIDNIKIVSDYSRLKYCIFDGDQKKCGEVRK